MSESTSRALTDTGMPSGFSMMRVVAGREISVKVHDKAFIFSTLFFLVVIAVSIALPAVFGASGSNVSVAMDDGSKAWFSQAEALSKMPTETTGLPEVEFTGTVAADADAINSLVSGGDVDLGLITHADGSREIIGNESVSSESTQVLTAAAAQADRTDEANNLELSATDLQALLAPTPPETVVLSPADETPVPPFLIALVFIMLYYVCGLLFGTSIAQSVVEEKQSRVVELLVAAIPVRWLLAGKVAGNALMAFAQIAAIVAVALLGAALTGYQELLAQIAVPSLWFVVFFILGFLMLAGLWAAGGALASRIEELSATTNVIQIFLIVPFLASIMLMDPGPGNLIASYIPFTSPFIMPVRMLTGDAMWWEPLVAAAILVMTIWAAVLLAARLYEASIMHTSGKLSFKQAFAMGKEESPVD